MYPQSEILFPHRAIRPLGRERGAEWQELVDQVASQRDGNEDTLAFSLMMIRLCDCLSCDQSCYKASWAVSPVHNASSPPTGTPIGDFARLSNRPARKSGSDWSPIPAD